MEDKQRYLIIHGHFYQPPRENPWTGGIERQKSAAPFHDWNERIASQCYSPNCRSRRVDEYGRITKLVNNYCFISFNFGPTLLSWLEEKHPDAYEKIIEADRISASRLGGHGNALAQAYNHIIMPLAGRRDQETQIRWGVHDFVRRFGREPEGIWLPETAINETTLDILIDFGFGFIVISPSQAQSVRPLDRSAGWKDVSGGTIRTGFPYRCFKRQKKSGKGRDRCIDIFFYDAPLSTDVSFNHLLRNGDNFADAIEAAFPRSGSDLVVIATDGEIYGHHEPFADMALSYLIDRASPSRGLEMTNFGTYLDGHEPQWEVRLKPGPHGEGTSWSCAHGVGRWKEDCGCRVTGDPSWNQKWRTPLRKGLEELGEALARIYEEEGSILLRNPWRARDGYIALIEEKSPEAAKAFVSEHASRPLSASETSRALALLESQHNALLMFTSCGWFFNDISGIETIQLLKYAARAAELAGAEHTQKLEKRLVGELETARSNRPDKGSGMDLYRNDALGSAKSASFLTAQFAISSYLYGREDTSDIFGYRIRHSAEDRAEMGDDSVLLGAVEITDPYTLDAKSRNYMLLVENPAGFKCFVGSPSARSSYGGMKEHLLPIAGAGDKNGLLQAAAEHIAGKCYTLKDMLPEDRERTLELLASNRLDELLERFKKLYLENRDLLHILHESSVNPPPGLLAPAQTVLTKMLADEVEHWKRTLDPGGLKGIKKIIAEEDFCGVPTDKSSAAESFSALVLEKLGELGEKIEADTAESLLRFAELSSELGIKLDETAIQNEIYEVLEHEITPLVEQAAVETGEGETNRAVTAFLRLAQRFNFNTVSLEERPGAAVRDSK